MKINEQYMCKRLALNMSRKEFAAIAGVEEGIYSLFERGEHIDRYIFEKIKYNIEKYIRDFPRKKYLTTRIIEETLNLKYESEADHQKTLSHLMIHVSKLNMMYVDGKEEFE